MVIAEGVVSEAELQALIEVGFDGATGPAIKEPSAKKEARRSGPPSCRTTTADFQSVISLPLFSRFWMIC